MDLAPLAPTYLPAGLVWVSFDPDAGDRIFADSLAKGGASQWWIDTDGRDVEVVAFQALDKAGGPRGTPAYIKRWKTPSGRWAYAYARTNAAGARTIGAGHFGTEHMTQGARFAHGDGHFEIHEDHGDHVTVSHNGGAKQKISKQALSEQLQGHHAEAINAHRESLNADHVEAEKSGNLRQAAKLHAEKLRHGYTKPEAAKAPADPDQEHYAKTYGTSPEQWSQIKAKAGEISGGKPPSREHMDHAAAHVLSGGKVATKGPGTDRKADKAVKDHLAARQGLVEGHKMALDAGNEGIATAIRHSAKAAGHDIDFGQHKDAPIPQVDEGHERTKEALRDPRIATSDDVPQAKREEPQRAAPKPPAEAPKPAPIASDPSERDREARSADAERAALGAKHNATIAAHKSASKEHARLAGEAMAQGDTEGHALHNRASEAHRFAADEHDNVSHGNVKASLAAAKASDKANAHQGPKKGGETQHAPAPEHGVTHELSSSVLKQMSWTPDKAGSQHGKVRVHFRDGSVHEWSNVPHHAYDKVAKSHGSHGSAYQEHIRGQYPSQKLREADGGALRKENLAQQSAARQAGNEARKKAAVNNANVAQQNKDAGIAPAGNRNYQPPESTVPKGKTRLSDGSTVDDSEVDDPFDGGAPQRKKPASEGGKEAQKPEPAVKQVDKPAPPDHRDHAQQIYGLDDKATASIKRQTDASPAYTAYVKSGDHDNARAHVRERVKSYLAQHAQQSPSQTERFMKEREKQHGVDTKPKIAIQKAHQLSEAEHRQRVEAAKHHASRISQAAHPVKADEFGRWLKPDTDARHAIHKESAEYHDEEAKSAHAAGNAVLAGKHAEAAKMHRAAAYEYGSDFGSKAIAKKWGNKAVAASKALMGSAALQKANGWLRAALERHLNAR